MVDTQKSSGYLAIIPARGGSKRILGKNLATLGGKPLLLHTVEAALGAKRLGRVMVSTDDAGIASVAEAAHAEVPVLRPAQYARDESTMMEVIQHAVSAMEPGDRWIEAVVLLQPTSPFRTSSQIDAAIELFEKSAADILTSVRAAAEHPFYAWRVEGDDLQPFFSLQHQQMVRQSLPPAVVEAGAIFVLRRSLVDQGTFYGNKVVPFELDERASLDIDTPQDLAFAEFLLSRESGTAKI